VFTRISIQYTLWCRGKNIIDHGNVNITLAPPPIITEASSDKNPNRLFRIKVSYFIVMMVDGSIISLNIMSSSSSSRNRLVFNDPAMMT
jgi:hypothetical protein